MLLLPALLFYIKKIWPVQLRAIIFGSVRFLSKKSNQNRFRNRCKPTGFGFVQLFWEKNRFGSVFPVWLGFFPVWLGFSRFGSVFFRCFSVWVWFGSVQFQAYKTKIEPNRLVFFKILISLIGFFSRFGFFVFSV